MHNARNMTLDQIKEHFQAQHNLTMTSLVVHSIDGKAPIVYNSRMGKTKDNLNLTLSQMIAKYCGMDPATLSYFVPAFLFENEDMETVETPEVVLWM
jgi:hypothetical protein